jgi:hypothetical protein
MSNYTVSHLNSPGYGPGAIVALSSSQPVGASLPKNAIMYRITDRQHTDALLAAVARGVRLITEQEQYRDPTRLWHLWNVDRLHIGVQTWNAAGYGPWNGGASFTLKALAKPTLISPNGSAPGWPVIEFRRNRVAGASHHFL